MLKLARTGDAVSVDEVWANQRVRIHFGNAVRHRRAGSTRRTATWASAPFAAIDVKTGEMLWRDRSVTRATLVGAGDQLVILLDEDGNLALATPGDSGLQVHGKVQHPERARLDRADAERDDAVRARPAPDHGAGPRSVIDDQRRVTLRTKITKNTKTTK